MMMDMMHRGSFLIYSVNESDWYCDGGIMVLMGIRSYGLYIVVYVVLPVCRRINLYWFDADVLVFKSIYLR